MAQPPVLPEATAVGALSAHCAGLLGRPSMRASVKGFGRRPFATVGLRPGPALESLPRRKPRGGWGTVWRARLWGFEDRGRLASEASAIGDARCFQRKRRWLGVSMATMRGSEALASVAGGLATSRGRRARVPARGWRRRRSTVRGGMRGDGHEESILIRLGDGERQGRGPSNVSTMIIRPPTARVPSEPYRTASGTRSCGSSTSVISLSSQEAPHPVQNHHNDQACPSRSEPTPSWSPTGQGAAKVDGTSYFASARGGISCDVYTKRQGGDARSCEGDR